MPNVDLNLIKVFLAVYESGSVSAAALRLNVTQPSVSHGLARLRDLLHNPLFQRRRQGMVPTALSEEIYPSFRSSLSHIEATMLGALAFDPAQSRRRFRIAMTDFGEIAFLPEILRRLALEAPMVNLDVVTVQSETIADLLSRNQADLAICPDMRALSAMRSAVIFSESYECIHRIGHPRVSGPLSLSNYLAESHVVASSSTGHTLIESYWKDARLEPRIAVRLPNLGVIEAIVASSDYLAAVPSRIARSFSAMGRVATVNLPLPLPEFEVRAYWMEDLNAPFPEERWFRETVLEVVCRASSHE